MNGLDGLRGTEPTPAELAVLYLLERPGATYATVANDISVSESAVKHRLRKLYARLGVTSAHQARAALKSRGRQKVPKKTVPGGARKGSLIPG